MKILIVSEGLIKEAEKQFRKVDRQLTAAMKEIGPCLLANRKPQPFRALVSAVIGQQLSEQAATSIRRRLADSLDSDYAKWPGKIARSRIDHLTQHGLSGAKANCLIELAQATVSGTIDFDELARMPDDEVLEALIRFKGIGRWTAEMFLIFGLKRPDVFSMGDMGLRRAIQLTYGFNHRPEEEEMALITESWRPYRTIGSWYLWQVLDTGKKDR